MGSCLPKLISINARTHTTHNNGLISLMLSMQPAKLPLLPPAGAPCHRCCRRAAALQAAAGLQATPPGTSQGRPPPFRLRASCGAGLRRCTRRPSWRCCARRGAPPCGAGKLSRSQTPPRKSPSPAGKGQWRRTTRQLSRTWRWQRSLRPWCWAAPSNKHHHPRTHPAPSTSTA